jgi:hypothetical protein
MNVHQIIAVFGVFGFLIAARVVWRRREEKKERRLAIKRLQDAVEHDGLDIAQRMIDGGPFPRRAK